MIRNAVVPDRCVAGLLCAGLDRRQERPRPALTEGRPLCTGCLARAASDVPKLSRDWADLENFLPPSTSRVMDPDAPAAIKGEDPTPPYRLAVDALQREIQHVATTWAAVLGEVEQLAEPVELGVRPGYAVAKAVRILGPRTDLLATIGPVAVFPTGSEDEPDDVTGAQALLALTRLHNRARTICGLDTLTHHLPGACPMCGNALIMDREGNPTDTVYRRPSGSETVYCSVCNSRRTWDDYRRYVTMELWTRGQA